MHKGKDKAPKSLRPGRVAKLVRMRPDQFDFLTGRAKRTGRDVNRQILDLIDSARRAAGELSEQGSAA